MQNKQQTKKKLTATVLIMAAVTVIAKLLGLLRDILQAMQYGTGTESVAYETAARLPLLLFDFVIGGVITAAFIPVFAEIREKRGGTDALRFASDYFNLVFTVTLILTLIGEAAAPLLVRFMAPHISAEASALAVPLTRVMFPVVMLAGIAFCFVGLLQSNGVFRLPAVISLFGNGAVVLYLLFFSDRFGIYGLAVSLVLGWALQAAVQIPRAHSLGFRLKPTAFMTPDVRRAASAFLPVLVCSWLLPLTGIINTRFASGIADGSAVTAIGYANRFYIIIVGVFSFIATNLLFPYLSRAFAAGDRTGAKRITASSLKLLLAVILPITAGTFVLALPLIRLVFLRGSFTAKDAELTATALRWFALGMPGMALNEVMLKSFFASRKLRLPMLFSVTATVIDYLCCALLTSLYGIGGIAASCGIAVTLCAAANYIADSADGGALLCVRDWLDIFRCAVFAAVCGAAAYFSFTALSSLAGETLALLFSVLCGAAVYFILVLIFPTPEISAVLHRKKETGNR